jgi:hypothetical protein
MMEIEHIARIVIPSSAAVSLGIEILLFSFMLSTFELHVRPFTGMSEQINRDAAKDHAALGASGSGELSDGWKPGIAS